MTNPQSGLSFHWLTAAGVARTLEDERYTLVNSLSYLKAYALKHKPKAPPVVPPPEAQEVPF